jgi:hypothetical protein
VIPARACLAVLGLLAAVSTSAPAQGADTPAALGRLVLERFQARQPAAFDSVVPDEAPRQAMAWAVEGEWPLTPGESEVLSETADRAVLRITGVPVWGNSGDETIVSQMFSGLFEASHENGVWRLGRRLPVDAANRLRTQALDVVIEPGRGLRVRDSIELEVGGEHGWWAYLNHAARLDTVRLDGRPADYRFSGGLLWLRTGPGRHLLELVYGVDVARDSAGRANSGRFGPDFGHVRNQYFWHPFFDFGSDAGQADIRIRVKAPAAYRIATGVAQTERIEGDLRLVEGRTAVPTFALSLLYDRGWTPTVRNLGNLRAEFFVTPEFEPAVATLDSAVARTHRVLSARFGEPKVPYIAVAQSRARDGNGWHYRSNDLVVAGRQGGMVSRGIPRPSAWLGHEVAHGWTAPGRPGLHFLSEGWATYAEAVLVADEYGPEAGEWYWELQRAVYVRRDFDGKESLLADLANGGVSYYKGAWVLRMLERVMGREAFDRGMRAYMAIPAGRPASVTEFTAAMSQSAGRDLAPFLRPWIDDSVIPAPVARVEPGRVVVTQPGPAFRLPLEVELRTPAGPVRRRLELARAADTLDVRDVDGITGVVLDPDHEFLIRRAWGDTVRLALSAPGAKEVKLYGTWVEGPVAAERRGEEWVVELPLTAGRYGYSWSVDGEYRAAPEGGPLVVAARVELPEALWR